MTLRNLLERTHFFVKIIAVKAKAQKNTSKLSKTKGKQLISMIQDYIMQKYDLKSEKKDQ